jgi:hypothetical protein
MISFTKISILKRITFHSKYHKNLFMIKHFLMLLKGVQSLLLIVKIKVGLEI